jgi:uncharacterized protein YukE
MNDETEPTRTVRNDGITVRKTVEDDGGVRLEVASDRDSATTVRVTDPTLASRSNEEIRFDAEDDAEWVIEDGSTFERAFDPDDRRTIRYRIPDADPESLDSEPELSMTEGSVLDDITDRARSDALREFVGGDRDSLDPVSDPVDAAPDGDSAETTAGGDTAETDTTETATEETTESAAESDTDIPSDEDADTAKDAPPDEGLAVPSGGVARVLLAELRNDRVDDETAAALRSELGVEGENSREVRLKHLQSEVSDLAAYTDTIESFIDRYGTFGSVVDDVRSELSALEDRTERIDSTVEERAGSIDRIDEIDDELEAIRSTQSELESDLEEIRSTQADFESRFDSLDETITEIDEALDDLELFKERVSEVFRDLRTDDSEE